MDPKLKVSYHEDSPRKKDAAAGVVKENDTRAQERRLVLSSGINNCSCSAFAASLTAHSGKLVTSKFLIKVGLEWLENEDNWHRDICVQSIGGGWSGTRKFKFFVQETLKIDIENELRTMTKNVRENPLEANDILPLLCVAWSMLWRKTFKICYYQANLKKFMATVFHPIQNIHSHVNPNSLRVEHYTVLVYKDKYFGECGIDKFLTKWE
jgi:hypothetical protein